MIQLLKQYGARRNITEGILFHGAVQEQKAMKREKTRKTDNLNRTSQVKAASGAMSEAMSALRVRGERLEKLDNKTAQRQHDAANYSSMAKKLKEKS